MNSYFSHVWKGIIQFLLTKRLRIVNRNLHCEAKLSAQLSPWKKKNNTHLHRASSLTAILDLEETCKLSPRVKKNTRTLPKSAPRPLTPQSGFHSGWRCGRSRTAASGRGGPVWSAGAAGRGVWRQPCTFGTWGCRRRGWWRRWGSRAPWRPCWSSGSAWPCRSRPPGRRGSCRCGRAASRWWRQEPPPLSERQSQERGIIFITRRIWGAAWKWRFSPFLLRVGGDDLCRILHLLNPKTNASHEQTAALTYACGSLQKYCFL